MPRFVLCGDVHGKWNKLFSICEKHQEQPHHPDTPLLVIGDMGIGFGGRLDPELPVNCYFFRGNHDNPTICKAHPKYAVDWGMWNGMFIVAGGDSVDKKWRCAGYDWWADEQLNREELELMLVDYEKAKPRIVVTHEAPFRLHNLMAAAARLRDPDTERWGEPRGNSTAFALDSMLKVHRPEMWFFGHWHTSLSVLLHGTRFRCLDELEIEEITL